MMLRAVEGRRGRKARMVECQARGRSTFARPSHSQQSNHLLQALKEKVAKFNNDLESLSGLGSPVFGGISRTVWWSFVLQTVPFLVDKVLSPRPRSEISRQAVGVLITRLATVARVAHSLLVQPSYVERLPSLCCAYLDAYSHTRLRGLIWSLWALA
jgi:hypothetical protein